MAEISLAEAFAGLPSSVSSRLLSELGAQAHAVRISGVAHDSRAVSPGDLFVAWQGERFDGRQYAAAAAASGAVAVLADGGRLEQTQDTGGELTSSPSLADLPWLQVDEPRRYMAPIAARVHEHPDRHLRTVGVTGTNGKTTVVCLLEHLLTAAGWPCGRLGTLGYRFAEHDYGGERTTPEASELFRILEHMRSVGAKAVAMEVSSHALDQNRVGEMLYDVAVFTNLTRDHLDYHHTLDGYFAAKTRLFDQLKDGGSAVVGIDDEWGALLAERLRERDCRVLTFSDKEPADVHAADVTCDLRGIRGTLRTPSGALTFETRLIGRYNLLNVLAAVAACELLDVDPEAIAEALGSQTFVPGRLDPVVLETGSHPPVLIDFAHTPGALSAALTSMREVWPGRIAIVFGCGGEKDRGKRSQMGAAAGRLADLAIATSDNPRRESPEAILASVVEGIESVNGRYEAIVDRREAIERALELAMSEPNWAVLVAGKGHEREQVIGERRIAFDDRDEVERKLKAELKETGRAHVDG